MSTAEGMSIERILDAIQDGDPAESFEITGMSDATAARMVRRKAGLERELGAGRAWWERRRDALKRAVGWIDGSLERWARETHAENGLKTFPCGEGMARLAKARPAVEWNAEAAREWLVPLALNHPELIKSFDLAAVLREHVVWSDPDAQGVRSAMLAGDDTGEVLAGLTKDERPGELTCSVKVAG